MAYGQAENWESKVQEAEGHNSSIRLELLSVDTERRHLRERVNNLEREIQEVQNRGLLWHILKQDFEGCLIKRNLLHFVTLAKVYIVYCMYKCQ